MNIYLLISFLPFFFDAETPTTGASLPIASPLCNLDKRWFVGMCKHKEKVFFSLQVKHICCEIIAKQRRWNDGIKGGKGVVQYVHQSWEIKYKKLTPDRDPPSLCWEEGRLEQVFKFIPLNSSLNPVLNHKTWEGRTLPVSSSFHMSFLTPHHAIWRKGHYYYFSPAQTLHALCKLSQFISQTWKPTNLIELSEMERNNVMNMYIQLSQNKIVLTSPDHSWR